MNYPPIFNLADYYLNINKNKDYVPTYVILFAESPCSSGNSHIYEWEMPELFDPDNDGIDF